GDGKRKADAGGDERDLERRTHDRAVEAGGSQPDEPGQRRRIGDDDRRRAAVLDPYVGAGARFHARVGQLHARRNVNTQQREIGSGGGGPGRRRQRDGEERDGAAEKPGGRGHSPSSSTASSPRQATRQTRLCSYGG